MAKDNLERYMQEHLEGYDSPVDVDQLWANIAPVVEANAKVETKSSRWNQLALVTLILLFLANGIWMWTKFDSNNTNFAAHINAAQVDSVQKNKIPLSQVKTPDFSGISPKHHVLPPTKANTSTKPSHSQSRKSTQSRTKQADNSNNFSESFKTTSIKDIADQSVSFDEMPKLSNTQDFIAKGGDVDVVRAHKVVEMIDVLAISLIEENGNEIMMPFIDTQKKVKGKTFSNWTVSAFLGGGGHIPFKILEAKANEYIDFADKRSNSETPLEAVSAEAILELEHTRGFYFQAGVSYLQINERFDDVSTFSSLAISQGVVDLVTNTTTKKIYNHYQLVNIPLTVGYKIYNGSWTYGLDAGVFFNLSNKIQGESFGVTEQYESLSTWKNQSIGLGYRGGLLLGYELRDGVEIQIRPSYTLFNRSFFSDDYPLIQKFSTAGINAGLQIKF